MERRHIRCTLRGHEGGGWVGNVAVLAENVAAVVKLVANVCNKLGGVGLAKTRIRCV